MGIGKKLKNIKTFGVLLCDLSTGGKPPPILYPGLKDFYGIALNFKLILLYRPLTFSRCLTALHGESASSCGTGDFLSRAW